MNLQSILTPIANLMVWTFENILEPLANIPNWIFIIVGVAGMIYWLNVQKKYNLQAEREGTMK